MMNKNLSTQPSTIFSQIKVRYIFLNLLLLQLGLGLILGFIIGIISLFFPPIFKIFLSPNVFFIHAISYIFTFSLLSWLIFKKIKSNQISLRDILGNFKFKKQQWQTILILIFAGQLLLLGINQLTIFFTGFISQDFTTKAVEQANQNLIYDGNNPGLKIIFSILFFVMVVVVAPITEEFIFRGIILHRWGTKWGVIPAILLSSILFGLIHLNIFFISLAIWAVFLAFLYIKTGSLIVPIIAHALNNFIVFVVLIWSNNFLPANSSLEITINFFWRGIIFIALATPPLLHFLKLPNNREHLPYFTNRKNNQKISY